MSAGSKPLRPWQVCAGDVIGSGKRVEYVFERYGELYINASDEKLVRQGKRTYGEELTRLYDLDLSGWRVIGHYGCGRGYEGRSWYDIDVIVKAKDDIPIKSSKLYYVEFKNYLTKDFNHSFENLHSIICWDINLKDLKNNDEVIDIANQRRTLKIIQPEHEGDYTRYYLDSMRSGRKIEVFVLKYYLKEKLGIEFVPRTEKSTI